MLPTGLSGQQFANPQTMYFQNIYFLGLSCERKVYIQ
jgi:hypothetical protein